MQIAQLVQNPGIQNVGNHNGLSVDPGIENQYGIGNIAQNEAWIQLNFEEFDFMATAGTSDEIEEANVNYTLKDNLQQASTLGTQTDSAPVYYSDGSAEVHQSGNCYDNDIFNMFTQEEQYTKPLEPIPEPHQV
ncbi:hypothetical protein Tco_1100727 [Tanacetum coccineum]